MGVFPSAKEESDCAAGGGIERWQTHAGGVAVAATTAVAEAGKRNTVGGGRVRGLAWHVGDEGWSCDCGASTHMTCYADHIISFSENSFDPASSRF